MGYNMSVMRKQPHLDRPSGVQTDYTQPPVHSEREIQVLEEHLGPIAVKMVNDEGEVDLRKLTGDEALRYMAAMGIQIGGRVLV